MTARKAITWIAVLAATHLAAFFLAHRQPETAGAATASPPGADPARNTKAGERDQRSPRHAQLWQKLLDSPMERADFERTRDRLLQDWMKRDLGAVLDLMCGPESSRAFDSYHLQQAVDAEIAKNPEQVLEWIRSGRFGSSRHEVFQRWFSALKESGQEQAILASLPEVAKYEQFWSLRALSGKRDERLLAGVRQALQTWYRDGMRRQEMVDNYARVKAELAAGNTTALFAQETDPEIRLALGKGWTSARIGYPPTAERMGELRELPEDARARAVADIMTTFDDDHIKGLAPALAEMNRLEMWSDLASEGARQSVLVCANYVEDQHAVLGAVMGIGDSATRAKLLESAGRGMVLGGDAGPGFGSVDAVVPEGADRDACLAGMVAALWERGDQEAAKRGFQGIADKGKRSELLGKLPELAK